MYTKIVFCLALKIIKPDIICDVGAFNAHDSLKFRLFAPKSRILALEANTLNFSSMQNSNRLKKGKIEIYNKAAFFHDGFIDFHVDASDDTTNPEKFATSKGSILLKSKPNSSERRTDRVESIRLDSLLSDIAGKSSVCLWIDVEGVAFEVLLGMKAIQNNVKLIHLEIETSEIWKGQHKLDKVLKIMKCYGMVPLTYDKNLFKSAGNIIFVDKNEYNKNKIWYNFIRQISFWIELFLSFREIIFLKGRLEIYRMFR